MRRLLPVLAAALAVSSPVLMRAVLAERGGSIQPAVFAIAGARVVTEPGHVLPAATVVIRAGHIDAVGAAVSPPAGALVIDGKGLTVYPGFIDATSHWGIDNTLRRSQVGDPRPVDYTSAALGTSRADNRKGMTPEFLVSAALKMDEGPADGWRRAGFTARLAAPEGGIFTGRSALVSLSGAPPREAALRSPVALHAAFRVLDGTEYPLALMGSIAHARQTLLDAGYHQRRWSAYEQAGRAGPRPPLDPALDALVPVLAGKLPVVFEADTRDEIGCVLDFAQELKIRPIIYGGRDAWQVVERIKRLNVPVLLRLNFTDATGRRTERHPRVFMSFISTPEDDNDLPPRVRDDEARQLREDLHNAAVLADNGVPFAFSTHGVAPDVFWQNLHKVIVEGGLSADRALAALTAVPARLMGVERQLGSVAVGKAAHVIVMTGDFHDPGAHVRHVFADTAHFEYDTPAKKSEPGTPAPGQIQPAKPQLSAAADSLANTQVTELDADRKPRLRTGGNVLLRGATVLTVSHGALAETDILVQGGKIVRIGKSLKGPAGVTIIPAEGMFVMPGIIDTHCHFGIAGGVNEYSLSVTPEVRVRDVISSDDLEIYRGLAGGVTTARLLHGSENPIGGQHAVIKLKYGRPANELLIPDAPRGVKFALGENVKQTAGRFPNTRPGIEAVIVRALGEARAYRREWQDYEKAKAAGKSAVEPRRDLRLEALADILAGDLKVHSHCYRQDEILALLNVAERFGFKIQSLQHALEGYKVAAEIAEHGASCSTFADWWAYKMEAYDAIPHNTALLTEAGASVCLKSDSNELMRHLYQEAAKCVKYGGMSEDAALATITLNGAKQLGLDKRLGSIDVGKDADLVVFNGHPLNTYARPELTLIDGDVYFQRSDRLLPNLIAQAGPTVPAAGSLTIARNPAGAYALTGVTVHPASRPPIEGATVLVEKGRIRDVLKGIVVENAPVRRNPEGPNTLTVSLDGTATVVPVPPGTVVVRGDGFHLYPGMIDAATILGLTEIDGVRETRDFADIGDFQPDLRASVAINPDSELIPVTRANGVTTVLTCPEGGIIAGQSALFNLAGWVPKEMVLVDQLALHVELPRRLPHWPDVRTGKPSPNQAEALKQRDEKVRRLKELFRQAVAYDDSRKQTPATPANPRLEALVPYARGLKPVIITARRRNAILEALKLGDELKLRVIISGGVEAWKVADELKKRQVPVIVGPVMQVPLECYDPYDAPYACPARLRDAGVPFCICQHSTEEADERNLPYEAAMAVAFGLSPDEGLKAVTLYPAEILGVADQLGSIDVGKRANLVLANGDLLQASTQVVGVFIDGRPLPPTSKQTRLYDRYRDRLREVRESRGRGSK
jgi:imidazolonepropionase-like amidohydrolase